MKKIEITLELDKLTMIPYIGDKDVDFDNIEEKHKIEFVQMLAGAFKFFYEKLDDKDEI